VKEKANHISSVLLLIIYAFCTTHTIIVGLHNHHHSVLVPYKHHILIIGQPAIMSTTIINETIERKRKLSYAPSDHCIVPPRFISAKKLRVLCPSLLRSSFSSPHSSQPASFTALPQELFCKIVAYIGPTSSSLCALSQVTREHNAFVKTIGDAMMQRASLRFRIPLPPKSECESSISLFVRHARASKCVHDSLEVLDGVLRKEFPVVGVTSTSFHRGVSKQHHASPEPNSEITTTTTSLDQCNRITIKPSEVDHALNIALCLLSAGKKHYHIDLEQAMNIAESASTTALAWRVSSLCRILGAKAYQYAKARICSAVELEEQHDYSIYQVTDVYRVEYEEGDEFEDDDLSVDSSDFDVVADEDMMLLDKASLVMKLTVLRDASAHRQVVG
jgi:hypothetical protein